MRDINLFIIAVSYYGDRDELLQYYRVMMEFPVFATIKAIVSIAVKKLGASITIQCFNERLQNGDGYLTNIISQTKTTSCNLAFITLKTFEIPRAIDVARRLKKGGLKVVLGGPGITLADWKTLKLIIDEGFSINVGEGELTISEIIDDTLNGRLKLVYWQKEFIDLYKAPFPKLPKKEEHRFSINKFCALNTSEGCPHNCSFCCVTKLRGRKICKERSRDPEACVDWIEQAHRRGFEIFLTSDNFIRSYFYPQLKEGLIKLNEKLNNKLYLFVQLDANAISEVKDLRRMGISSVFFGFETTDRLVLEKENKRHNRPENFKKITREFQKQEIFVSTGLMVGFSSQTPDSIKKDIKRFSEDIGLIAYLYAVTPLPGSRDYAEAVAKHELLTYDLNLYDTRHFVRNWFLSMTQEEAQNVYDQSLVKFFSLKHILRRYPKWSIWAHNLKMTAFIRFMAEYGRMFSYRPLHAMHDGPFPRKPIVWRPSDSFCGFELTADDLLKKNEFLESLI